MSNKTLLRILPYKITPNSKSNNSVRIVLNPMSGFQPGDKVYQVKRSNGIIELIPEDLMNIEDYV
jgi:hypothetical protein